MRWMATLAVTVTLVAPAMAQTEARVSANPEDFHVDAYENRAYLQKPLPQAAESMGESGTSEFFAAEAPVLPVFSAESISDLGLNPEETLRARTEVLENSLLEYLEALLPEIADLRQENSGFEFEINHYMKLRRAELKELNQKILSMQEKRDKFQADRRGDINEVKQSIRKLYEEIDLHLEDPSSAYNDDFVTHRKNLIRRLMRKELALGRDFKSMNYEPYERMEKNLNFLTSRRDEVLQHLKDMTFPFVLRKKELVTKNNARINYLVSRLPEDKLKPVRDLLANIRSLKVNLSKMEGANPKSAEQRSLEEDVRFEQEYYARLSDHDQKEMQEARRLRELNDSLAATSHSASQVVKRQEERLAEAAKKSESGQKQKFIYILPLQDGEPFPQLQTQKTLMPGAEHTQARPQPRLAPMPMQEQLQSLENIVYEEKPIAKASEPAKTADHSQTKPVDAPPAVKVEKEVVIVQPPASQPSSNGKATEEKVTVEKPVKAGPDFGSADDFALGLD